MREYLSVLERDGEAADTQNSMRNEERDHPDRQDILGGCAEAHERVVKAAAVVFADVRAGLAALKAQTRVYGIRGARVVGR